MTDSTSASQNRFPLNAVDRAFLANEFEGCVCNSHFLVDTAAPWDRNALIASIDALMEELPVLKTVVREVGWKVWREIPASTRGAGSLITEADESEDPNAEARFVDAPFDLYKEPALRFLLLKRANASGYRFYFTVHHSLADGGAESMLLRRLVQLYDQALAGTLTTPKPNLDDGRMRFRDVLQKKGGFWWFVRMIARHFRPASKFGTPRASLHDDETPKVHTSTACISIDINPSSWSNLQLAARFHKCTRNQLLLSAFFRAAVRWRSAHKKPELDFRVMLLRDLRTALDLPPSMQNIMGILPVDLSVTQVRARNLPQAIQEQVDKWKDLEASLEFPVHYGLFTLLAPMKKMRELFRNYDRDPKNFFYSFLFSQIRMPDEMPASLQTQNVWVRGSLARQPGFGVVANIWKDRVTVVFEYLQEHIGRASVDELAGYFLEELSGLQAEARTGKDSPQSAAAPN